MCSRRLDKVSARAAWKTAGLTADSTAGSDFGRRAAATGRYPGGAPQATVGPLRPSKELDRVHIECPADPARARERLDLRQPPVEEPVQPAPIGALDQQLSVVASGPT